MSYQRNKLHSCVLLLSLFFSAKHAYALGCSPVIANNAATQFLAALDRGRIFSVPTRIQLQTLHGVVTPTLYSQLKKASRAEELALTRTKGTQPPLYEGSLFSYLAEGHSSYTVIKPTSKTVNLIAVEFQYIGDPATGMPYNWVDLISVQTVSGKCLVRDMIFNEGRPPKKTLAKTLQEISGE